MMVELSATQVAIRQRFRDLLNDELLPSIRRMGEAPRTGEQAELGGPGGLSGSGELSGLRELVWRALADLGATRLLLPNRFGGEQLGQQGAVILAELLGTGLYQGPLLDTMIATELLLASKAETETEAAGVLGEIAGGSSVALAPRERLTDSHDRPGPISISAGTVTARRRLVGSAADVDYLLPIGTDPGGGCAVALVRRQHPTIWLRRHQDVSRGEFYDVQLAGTPALLPPGPAEFTEHWQRVLAQARIRQAAYLVGLGQGALDLAARRAGQRRQFGQPIGRFQALAFDLAQVAARLEAARWLVRATAWEADEGADVRLSAVQSLAMAADLARAATSTAVQVHGAYGTTEQADVQLYYRRAGIERVWLGAPKRLRAQAFGLLLARQESQRG